MPYRPIVADALNELTSFEHEAKGTVDEARQAVLYSKATRFLNVLTAVNDAYIENHYIGEKIGEAKTWMASLCARDEGNQLSQDQIGQSVTNALQALRSSHGFNVD